MQRIYEPENLMEGEMLKGMLATEGIEAHLIGRDLVGGAGELPIFGLLWSMVGADAVMAGCGGLVLPSSRAAKTLDSLRSSGPYNTR